MDHVIFSLTVQSMHPIPALETLRQRERIPGKPRPDDEYFYSAGPTFSFDEEDWQPRADKLDHAVDEALRILEATGVNNNDLAHEDVFVRAFFTFWPGAQTISAEIVERLARVHATIWIDAEA